MERDSEGLVDWNLGDSLNWDAPWTDAVLFVELPFWLMVPSSTHTVSINRHDYAVDVTDAFRELFAAEVTDSRRSVVYVGQADDDDLDSELVKGLEGMGAEKLWRKSKTLLRIHTRCNPDAHQAGSPANEDLRRFGEAQHYLKALCEAHLPVANALIRAYRLSTYDYFPFEVSPWDVPVWRVHAGAGFVRVPLLEYADWDMKPVLIGPDEQPTTYRLATPPELSAALTRDPTPGELDVLDAMNFMERGDYTGAVRRITTAIEAVVEAVLRAELLKKYDAADVEIRVSKSQNDFPGRRRQYQKLSGRQLPDVLAQDLDATRLLRHAIVHRGFRITFDERHRAQRAVDTGRWTFNWFEDNSDRRELRERRIGLRSLGRHFGHSGRTFPRTGL